MTRFYGLVWCGIVKLSLSLKLNNLFIISKTDITLFAALLHCLLHFKALLIHTPRSFSFSQCNTSFCLLFSCAWLATLLIAGLFEVVATKQSRPSPEHGRLLYMSQMLEQEYNSDELMQWLSLLGLLAKINHQSVVSVLFSLISDMFPIGGCRY